LGTGGDDLRFPGTSLGSLAEMETQRVTAHRPDGIDAVSLDRTCQASDRIGRMLRALMKSLQTRLAIPNP